ncbi:MAG: hypothetical protein ISR69_13190 [Gammaproteobacteria bacterium]|nr:hypothetical protein [Gammaproteobacteria bacterium]
MIIVLLLIVAIVGFGFKQHQDLQQLEQTSIELKQQKTMAKAELAAAQAEVNRIMNDEGLSEKIELLGTKIKAIDKVVEFVKQRQLATSNGFSSYLTALSRVNSDAIWLSNVSLTNGFMHLEGSALKEEKIPAYFHGFKLEPLFSGMVFDIFEIGRPEDHDWKVDFVIASKEGLLSSKGQQQ